MQIIPSGTTTANNQANNQANLIASKIVQILDNYVNKPLLIDKLVLNQTQGLLLNLSSSGNSQFLKLQLPLATLEQLKLEPKVNNTLSLSINNQQQIQLIITTSYSSASSTNVSPSVNTNVLDKSTLPASEQKMIFQQARLFTNQRIQLYNPIQTSLTKAGSQKNQLPEANILTATATSNIQLPIETEVSLATAAEKLLTSNFAKQLPIANFFSKINQISTQLNGEINSLLSDKPLLKELQQSLNQLLKQIQKPTQFNAKTIERRVKRSGQLLETNLLTQAKKKAQEHTQTPLTDDIKKQNKKQNLTTQKSSRISENNDVKLLLLKIKSNLEKLLSQDNQGTLKANQTIIKGLPSSNNNQLNLQNTRGDRNNTNLPVNAEKVSQELSSSNIAFNKIKPSVSSLSGRTNIQTSSQFRSEGNNLPQNLIKQAFELLAEVKNSLTQIESNQLLSLKNDTPNLHQFLVDLPFKNNAQIDSFEMLFEHSKQNNKDQKTRRWKVVVRFDLEPLGPMFAKIELENQKISTHLFSKRKKTAQLINQHLHVLKKSLFVAGVDIKSLQTSQGKIPERLVKKNQRLIDTHV